MPLKLLYITFFIVISYNSYSQNNWKQKVNFSNTASIVGKVSDKAKKVGDTAPGIVGSTARAISTTTKVISKAAKKADAIQNEKKKETE